MFGRATITLGIGPHSSCVRFFFSFRFQLNAIVSEERTFVRPLLCGVEPIAVPIGVLSVYRLSLCYGFPTPAFMSFNKRSK